MYPFFVKAAIATYVIGGGSLLFREIRRDIENDPELECPVCSTCVRSTCMRGTCMRYTPVTGIGYIRR